MLDGGMGANLDNEIRALRARFVAMREALATSPSGAALATLLEDPRMNRFDQQSRRVGVVGNKSSGKSTLCNALIGQDQLPWSDADMTGLRCEVRIGSGHRAWLIDKTGRREPIDPPTREAIEPLIRSKHPETREVNPRIETHDALRIELPEWPLDPGDVLVDTAGENTVRGQQILQHVPDECDTVVFLKLVGWNLMEADGDPRGLAPDERFWNRLKDLLSQKGPDGLILVFNFNVDPDVFSPGADAASMIKRWHDRKTYTQPKLDRMVQERCAEWGLSPPRIVGICAQPAGLGLCGEEDFGLGRLRQAIRETGQEEILHRARLRDVVRCMRGWIEPVRKLRREREDWEREIQRRLAHQAAHQAAAEKREAAVRVAVTAALKKVMSAVWLQVEERCGEVVNTGQDMRTPSHWCGPINNTIRVSAEQASDEIIQFAEQLPDHPPTVERQVALRRLRSDLRVTFESWQQISVKIPDVPPLLLSALRSVGNVALNGNRGTRWNARKRLMGNLVSELKANFVHLDETTERLVKRVHLYCAYVRPIPATCPDAPIPQTAIGLAMLEKEVGITWKRARDEALLEHAARLLESRKQGGGWSDELWKQASQDIGL